MGVANLPDEVKPGTCKEATSKSTYRAPRGEKGGRMRKDAPGTWETLQDAEDRQTGTR